MRSPIFRVIVEYGYRAKGSVRGYKYSKIDTFVFTDNIEMVKKDKSLIAKILNKSQSGKKEIDITFKNIYIEGQYGNTNY